MTISLEKKRWLMGALSAYKRWVREGELPHGWGPGHQRDYDSYHESITDEGGGVYGFSIQTYDSPGGDVWWHGRFRSLNGDTDVELLEERYDRF